MINPLYNRLEHLFGEAAAPRAVEVSVGVAVGTLRGPRAENQDRAAVAHVRRASPSDDVLVAMVCDGMGGMRDGSVAATVAISTFLTEFAAIRSPLPSRLATAMEQANRAVYERLEGRGGTTLTAVAASSTGETWAAHAGDSRVYGYTDHSGPDLLSQDDTVQGVVRAQNEGHGEGRDEDELDNRLLQFVGIGDGLAPHVIRLEGGADRTWFVTTDGAHGVGRKLLHSLARNARSVGDLARKLTFVVDAAPLGDNASIAAIRPSEFSSNAPFSDGLNLTVWTPANRLEIWLPDLQAVIGRQSPQPANPIKAPSKPDKKTRPRRAKPKPLLSLSPPDTEAAAEKSAPQLNIVFSDPDEKLND